MLKTDLMELKKMLKKNSVTISKMAACYVCGQDKSMYTSYQSFLNLPDEEFYKYLEILKQLMSCKAGDTMQSLPIENDDCKKVLESLRWSELKQQAVADAFFEKFKGSFIEDNNYAIFLFYSAYDIPARGTDKLKQGESDEVYNAIYGVVCPVELSCPGLSYFENSKEFHNRKRDPIVGKPIIGFLYPDYHNKEVVESKIAYGICDKKNTHNEIPKELFGSYKMPTAQEQAKILESALAESLADEDIEKVAKVTKNLFAKAKAAGEKIKEDGEKVSYNEESKTVEVIKEPVTTLSEIKDTIIQSGVEEEKAEKFVKTFKSMAPTTNDKIRVDKTSKRGKVQCGDIDISIPAEKMESVKVKVIDGKKCVVIELTDTESEVCVNGIACKNL